MQTRNQSSPREFLISKFSQWAQDGWPKTSARRLPSSLRWLINEGLPIRDQWSQISVRRLHNTVGLSWRCETDNLFVIPQEKEEIVTVAFYPAWGRSRMEYKEVFKDDVIYDELTDFLICAEIYISRSIVVGAVGAIALAYNRYCDHRTNTLQILFVGEEELPEWSHPETHLAGLGYRPRTQIVAPKTSRRQREATWWANHINAADPYVHRAVFQYIRSLALLEQNFAEEAITALDGVVAVAAQYARERLRIVRDDRWEGLYNAMSSDLAERSVLTRLHGLRSAFGAHPGISKWWDFGDLYGDELFDYGFHESVKNVLKWLCETERQFSIVRRPSRPWSVWFRDHATLLWDVAWFAKLPKLPPRRSAEVNLAGLR